MGKGGWEGGWCVLEFRGAGVRLFGEVKGGVTKCDTIYG